MSPFRFVSGAVALAAALSAPAVSPGQTLTLNQVDTFTSGTTANWIQGVSAPAGALTVVPGGPAGAADNFLQITSDGSGPGGRLTAFNQTQWVGNYSAAGINVIEMDLRAPAGATQPLSMRVAFRNGNSGYATPWSSCPRSRRPRRPATKTRPAPRPPTPTPAS